MKKSGLTHAASPKSFQFNKVFRQFGFEQGTGPLERPQNRSFVFGQPLERVFLHGVCFSKPHAMDLFAFNAIEILPAIWRFGFLTGEAHARRRTDWPRILPPDSDEKFGVNQDRASFPNSGLPNGPPPWPPPWIGSGAGDCAPAPSHTTGHTVFRIRRLDPAAITSRRKL